MLLGVPPGGGDADVVIEHRADGTGLAIAIPLLPYDATIKEWSDLFRVTIQPSLLYATGKVPSGIPGGEALEEARRRARPGRPPDVRKLDRDLRMWEFCYRNDMLGRDTIRDGYNAYLNSMPDDDPGISEIEDMDQETFRRCVKEIDRRLRPTGSGADISS